MINRKNLYDLLLIAMLTVSCVGFISCGDDDGDNDTPKPEPEIPIETEYSPIGVWEKGNYFISLNDDKFCCAFFAEDYIDCGSYSIKDKVITCNNAYYSKQTKYKITKLTDTSMDVTIDYTSMDGVARSKTISFKRNENKVPSVRDHSLVGKTYSSLVWLGETNTSTWKFESYNTATHSMKTGAASKYPLSVYYVFFDSKIYYQTYKTKEQMPTIGGWNPSTVVTISEVSFSSNGSIADIRNVK